MFHSHKIIKKTNDIGLTMEQMKAPPSTDLHRPDPILHSPMQGMRLITGFHPFMASNARALPMDRPIAQQEQQHMNMGPPPTNRMHPVQRHQAHPIRYQRQPVSATVAPSPFSVDRGMQTMPVSTGPRPGSLRAPSGNIRQGMNTNQKQSSTTAADPMLRGPPSSADPMMHPPPMRPTFQGTNAHPHRIQFQQQGPNHGMYNNNNLQFQYHPHHHQQRQQQQQNFQRHKSFPQPPPHMMQAPPNRRFTFHAITAPSKLMNGSCRSPSPPGIPPPPSMLERNDDKIVSSQNPSKRGNKSSSVMPLGQVPLRESRHLNNANLVGSGGGAFPSQQQTKEQGKLVQLNMSQLQKSHQVEESRGNEDTASILLELRISNKKSSPTTVAALQLPSNKHEEKRDGRPTIETANLPPAWIPENYPKRLAIPGDKVKLNSLHCFVRSELLEIFVVDQSICKSPTSAAGSGSALGRVGLRCVHCAQQHKRLAVHERNEAPMAVFYPKSVAEIYRLITSWQRCHLRKCRNLPPTVRQQWEELRQLDRSRGKTVHWITSAMQIGLVDCQAKAGGVRFSAKYMPNAAATAAQDNEKKY